MSILSDQDIFRLIGEKKLKISPLLVDQVQPASVDLRLGKKGKIIKSGSADLRNFAENSIIWEEIDLENGFILEPNAYLQAWTLEELELPININAKIFGKNSLLIVGLNVNTAFINPSFKGKMCLAIKNWTSIPLTIGYGMEICQVEFSTLAQTPTRGYREVSSHQIPLNDPVFSLFEKGEKMNNPLSRYLREQIDNIAK